MLLPGNGSGLVGEFFSSNYSTSGENGQYCGVSALALVGFLRQRDQGMDVPLRFASSIFVIRSFSQIYFINKIYVLDRDM